MVRDFQCSVATCEVNTPTTEDSYSILTSDDISLFAVFDGHGGNFASKYAATHLPGIIMSQLADFVQESKSNNTSPVTMTVNTVAECLNRSFCKCDEEILTNAVAQLVHTPVSSASISTRAPRFASVGSCASIVLLIGGVMFTAHCGDCRVVLCRAINAPDGRNCMENDTVNSRRRSKRLSSNTTVTENTTQRTVGTTTETVSSLVMRNSLSSLSRPSTLCPGFNNFSTQLSDNITIHSESNSHSPTCSIDSSVSESWFRHCSVKLNSDHSEHASASLADMSEDQPAEHRVVQQIPHPPPLPLPPLVKVCLAVNGESVGRRDGGSDRCRGSDQLLPGLKWVRDFHLEAVATCHFRRDFDRRHHEECYDKRAGEESHQCKNKRIEREENDTSRSGVVRHTKANSSTSAGFSNADSTKTSTAAKKTADIRSYFLPGGSSFLSPNISHSASNIEVYDSFPESNSRCGDASKEKPSHGSMKRSRHVNDAYMQGILFPHFRPSHGSNSNKRKHGELSDSCRVTENASKGLTSDSTVHVNSMCPLPNETEGRPRKKDAFEKFRACQGQLVPVCRDESKSKSKRKHAARLCTDFYCTSPSSQLEVIALTMDHCLDDPLEMAGLEALTSDPHPHRPSARDRQRYGVHAISRVAGSLSVTRALGDGYLKTTSLSDTFGAPHVPYISCLPTVAAQLLVGEEVAVILASDGLWNYIEPYEVAEIIHDCRIAHRNHSALQQQQRGDMPTNGHPLGPPSPAQCLLFKCQQNAANAAGMSLEALSDLPAGSGKRDVLDDITIIVLFSNLWCE